MRAVLILVVGLALTASAGFLAAAALGVASQEAARTVTVDVGTGEQGPPGPKGEKGEIGPPGPPGPAGLKCPAEYSEGVLLINAPKGQVRIWTCLVD